MTTPTLEWGTTTSSTSSRLLAAQESYQRTPTSVTVKCDQAVREGDTSERREVDLVRAGDCVGKRICKMAPDDV